MESKNEETLKSFNSFCKKYPQLRFWQALVAWSEYTAIYGKKLSNNELEDTFYKE